MSPAEQDAVADAWALIVARHDRDAEGAKVLLRYADHLAVLTFLAGLCDDLIGALARWNGLTADDTLADIRQRNLPWTGGTG